MEFETSPTLQSAVHHILGQHLTDGCFQSSFRQVVLVKLLPVFLYEALPAVVLGLQIIQCRRPGWVRDARVQCARIGVRLGREPPRKRPVSSETIRLADRSQFHSRRQLGDLVEHGSHGLGDLLPQRCLGSSLVLDHLVCDLSDIGSPQPVEHLLCFHLRCECEYVTLQLAREVPEGPTPFGAGEVFRPELSRVLVL